MSIIKQYGWNERFEQALPEHTTPGRIISEHKSSYRAITEQGEWLITLSGNFRHTHDTGEYPSVGDWVALEQMPGEDKGIIHKLLPRSSRFTRKANGETSELQTIAVNIDYIFLVMSLNHDFNVRRLERYLIAAWDSGAMPVVVLTKSDQCDDPAVFLEQVDTTSFGVDAFAVSAVTDAGMDAFLRYLTEGKTGALLGSSGVGKSSLINALTNSDTMAVQDIREDDSKGRHTTTHRELLLLPSGGLLIDTPGMREFQLGDSADGLDASFQDVASFAAECRFRDCSHQKEPGCRIQSALASGELPKDRYMSYLKLLRELEYIERKSNLAKQQAERMVWKQRSKELRSRPAKKR
ncbi:ribosome small subunit-dependent GTPase A [Planococcus sp. ISL-109]|uniref:ribosome small subunit-dependent GTPase A n=1 Tax=Planococcus sp. ISL-109 TaxID=2819166 RepID=UPI001BE4E1B8|nr:ribosome small subunit-dependent GTPase A [Planococcus sp. ISL-109]MBT2584148.1 ribosome small subunit-dependent GTPase A [Planococcus sp. ISL-109]